MPAKPKTYGEAVDQSRRLVNQARLDDPREHFPYKRDAVQQLLDDDPAMGPGTPGGADGTDDRSRRVSDYMTDAIADASQAYIAAQGTYLKDPSEDNRRGYEAAKDQLLAARLDHRQDRGQGFTIGAAAGRAV